MTYNATCDGGCYARCVSQAAMHGCTHGQASTRSQMSHAAKAAPLHLRPATLVQQHLPSCYCTTVPTFAPQRSSNSTLAVFTSLFSRESVGRRVPPHPMRQLFLFHAPRRWCTRARKCSHTCHLLGIPVPSTRSHTSPLVVLLRTLPVQHKRLVKVNQGRRDVEGDAQPQRPRERPRVAPLQPAVQGAARAQLQHQAAADSVGREGQEPAYRRACGACGARWR